ncbi:MAG: hypothetical protein V1897_04320, partial [Pseudomonadota bacterium]
MIPVYSPDGSPEFNRWMHETMTRIADEVQQAMGDNLVALIIGGGYGRGEGGMVVRNGREMPYNDIDFALVVRNKSKVPWDILNSISRSFASELTIHVDFSRPLTLDDIERWPSWLVWYDLLNGHIVVKGPSDIITKHAPSSLRQALPAIEGSKLLLNRGTGLLWSLRVIRGIEDSPDEDFVRRNYYKCALALGDSLLIAYKRFTTAYRGRDILLERLEQDEPGVAALGLDSLYREALVFKFRPDQLPAGDKTEDDIKAIARLWGTVFLNVETVRTGRQWSSIDEYVDWRGRREKDQHTIRLIPRNVARNLQFRRFSLRYPRETLYRQL